MNSIISKVCTLPIAGTMGAEGNLEVRVQPRYSLFTSEPQAEMMVALAGDLNLDGVTVELAGPGLRTRRRMAQCHQMQILLDLKELADGVYPVTCRVQRGNETLGQASTSFQKAPPKPNEVKIDYLSRGLIVEGLPFLPFGFYTFYPLKEGLPDSEVVNGFNMFSPYHDGPNLGRPPYWFELEAIRRYMDRSTAVGMKVNFHLMWANKPDLTADEWAQLRLEVESFRDHPALLSWYTADEPGADRAEHLTKVFQLIKELDPYHPVTMVFNAGGGLAKKFAGATDIVMEDLYPIPNSPVTDVGQRCDELNQAFDLGKPLWMVPQAFGGNEWWAREPTAHEERAMVYLGLLHGARGIQCFTRRPYISFPKSPILWGECVRLALETAELTPALLSVEKAPLVTNSLPAVQAQAYLDRGLVTLLAVNTENRPQMVRLQLNGSDFTGEAEVLFENRRVQVQAGAIEEPIDAYGTRAYALPIGPFPQEDLTVDAKNLTNNPSYEDLPNTGIPDGCYAVLGDGATAFVDSRVARHGRHSLRLIAPTDYQTPLLHPFEAKVKSDKKYRVSLWAKSKSEGAQLEVGLGESQKQRFRLTQDWEEYSFTCSSGQISGGTGLSLTLKSAGTVWVDLFQIVSLEE